VIAVGAAGSLVRQLGEPGGRAIIADRLGQALRGAPVIMDETVASWSDHELTAVCLWLRDVVARTCSELGVDPGSIAPAGDTRLAAHRMRVWNLAHQFLNGCWPAVGDALEICCRPCLADMTVCLGSAAAAVTAIHWGSDPEAEAHVVSGGELPARYRRSGADGTVPSFTARAAEAPAPS
jgi:hypothetical protein